MNVADSEKWIDEVYRPWYAAQTSEDDSGGNSPPPPPPKVEEPLD